MSFILAKNRERKVIVASIQGTGKLRLRESPVLSMETQRVRKREKEHRTRGRLLQGLVLIPLHCGGPSLPITRLHATKIKCQVEMFSLNIRIPKIISGWASGIRLSR